MTEYVADPNGYELTLLPRSRKRTNIYLASSKCQTPWYMLFIHYLIYFPQKKKPMKQEILCLRSSPMLETPAAGAEI